MFVGDTNFEYLLPLCREYQLDWLKDHFESYLCKYPPHQINKCVTALWLTEEYKFEESLKNILRTSCADFSYENLMSCKNWKKIYTDSLANILWRRSSEERFMTLKSSPDDWSRLSIKQKYKIAEKRLNIIFNKDDNEPNTNGFSIAGTGSLFGSPHSGNISNNGKRNREREKEYDVIVKFFNEIIDDVEELEKKKNSE